MIGEEEKLSLSRMHLIGIKIPFGQETTIIASPKFTGVLETRRMAKGFFDGVFNEPLDKREKELIERQRKHELAHALSDEQLTGGREMGMFAVTQRVRRGRVTVQSSYIACGRRSYEEDLKIRFAPETPSDSDINQRFSPFRSFVIETADKLIESLPPGGEINLGILFIRRGRE